MIVILIVIATLLFFPAIIFLDYHKRRNIHNAFWYLFFFIACQILLQFLISTMGLNLVYYLPVLPAALFGGLALKEALKRK